MKFVLIEKKSNVSFGTTRGREIFPSSVPHNRLASDLNPIRGAPNRGPGTYENEDVSADSWKLNTFDMIRYYILVHERTSI